ncbi:MAG: flagellar hook-length control protein FliK [Sphingomonadales bacterium]|nr:MAG: flagellar hook-length control protein FliK [Sphingomonadales bacterium]
MTKRIAPVERHAIAEPGKDLPAIAGDPDSEGAGTAADADTLPGASQDPAFAWFALPGLAAGSPAPAAPAVSNPAVSNPVAAEPAAPGLAPPPLAEAEGADAIAVPRTTGTASSSTVTTIATLLRDALGKADAGSAPVPDPRNAAALAMPATASALRTIPAGDAALGAVFAQPAGFSPLQRGIHRDLDQPLPITLAAPAAAGLVPIAAASGAEMSGLDLRRQEWMGQMIDTIEAMREGAPVRETRIALSPDALGKVDIAVRQDGNRVHVHIAAETQAARQILTDAQARLIEIAEQRGVRLGQMTVDQQGAQAQSGQRQPDAGQPFLSAPAPARAEPASTETDERIA